MSTKHPKNITNHRWECVCSYSYVCVCVCVYVGLSGTPDKRRPNENSPHTRNTKHETRNAKRETPNAKSQTQNAKTPNAKREPRTFTIISGDWRARDL